MSLARSLADREIRVNCVGPGPVWTPLIPATKLEEHVEAGGATRTGAILARTTPSPLQEVLVSDPQIFVNHVRELVFERDVIRRLGIEVLRASADNDQLSVRARSNRRLLDVERRDGTWLHTPPAILADEIVRELVAGVQADDSREPDRAANY